MPDLVYAVIVYNPIEQNQKIPIRLRSRISTRAGTEQHDLRICFYLADRLFYQLQQSISIYLYF